MPTATRRLAAVILAGLLLVPFTGPVSAAGATPFDQATLTQAATDLVALTNSKRRAGGLVALQADPDLMAIAQTRAEVMAANDVLSHTEPNGRNVFDRIVDAGLTWFGAGEIIAWNTYPTEPLSVGEAVYAWMHSPGHHAIMMSSGYNYVGYGAADSASGKHYYAGVFVAEPDETGAWVRVSTPTKTVLSAGLARVRVRWSGGDTRLQVRTSGLRYFQVQRRVVGGSWRTVGTTTATARTFTWARGHTYEIRVRARDRAGNWGAWRVVRVRI
jgi:uncharacterized protein YkwD